MAKRRSRMEQRLVDLAIVLESLLTPDGRVEQIALAVRTRGGVAFGHQLQGKPQIT
jgi:hypothetical protein